jgi:hypothetical protein
MAFRVVTLDGTRWSVSLVAERSPQSTVWRMVLGFRGPSAQQRSIWATYPHEFPSRSAVYAQAERLTDDTLAAVLAERIR